MWCKTCNIETNEELCPVCGSVTIEDLPTEVYWCAHCEVPIIQVATQADKGFCPLCAKRMKYLSADLRPVFPEERLLLELLLGEEPFAYMEKPVWAANSRYYINGKSVSISSKTFQDADTDALSKKLEQYRGQNTYEHFDIEDDAESVKIQQQTVASPIFFWKDFDIWLYILSEEVDFNDAYRLG